MQPISQVLIGSAGIAQPTVGQGGGLGAAPAPTISTAGQTQSVSMSSTSQSLAITRVDSQVAQMLQSIGGGLENDKTLQMLIALILLIALLEGSKDAAQSGGDAMQSLSGGSQDSGRAQAFSMFSSSTIISFQQTSITLMSSFSFSSSMDTTGAAPVGDQLDATA